MLFAVYNDAVSSSDYTVLNVRVIKMNWKGCGQNWS
jgi:hypothetical protein